MPLFVAEVGRNTIPGGSAASTITSSSTVTATGMMVAMVGFKDAGATDASITQIAYNTSGTATFFFDFATGFTVVAGAAVRRMELWTLECTATRIANAIASFSEQIQAAVLSLSLFSGVATIGAFGTATSGTSASPIIDFQTTGVDALLTAAIYRLATGNMTANSPDTERVDGNTGNSAVNDFNFYLETVTATAIGSYTMGASATTATGPWFTIGFEMLGATSAAFFIPQIEYNDRRRRV